MTQSEKNKRELNRLYGKLGYDHISFTIKPNSIVSRESLESEVLHVLKTFDPKTMKPNNDKVL